MDLHKRSVLTVDVLLEMMNAHYAAQRPGTDTTALKAIAEKMELAIEQALNAVVVGGQPCNRS